MLSKQLYYLSVYAGCTLELVGCVFNLYFNFDRVPWDSDLLLSGLFQSNINLVLTEKQFASLPLYWLIPLLFEVIPLRDGLLFLLLESLQEPGTLAGGAQVKSS